MLSTGKGFIQWIVLSTFHTTWLWWISAIIIHSKYFPVSDWVKPHAQFTITSGWTVMYIEPMTPVQWRHRETYPPPPSASVDNTLLDLQNSSYPTQPHSIIIANSTFEQPGHGVLIDKYLNVCVSTGSRHLESPWLWRHKKFNIIFCTCLWASAACLTSL